MGASFSYNSATTTVTTTTTVRNTPEPSRYMKPSSGAVRATTTTDIDQWWNQLMSLLPEDSQRIWLEPPKPGHTGLEVLFIPVDGSNIEATRDHILAYFELVGCSADDFMGAERMATPSKYWNYCLAVSVRTVNLLVWLLKIQPFEICGQMVSTRLSSRYTQSKSYFQNALNWNPLPQDEFFANFEAIRNFKPKPSKQRTVESKQVPAATKAYIWGLKYGDTPTLLTGLQGRTVTHASCGNDHVMFLTDTGRVFTTGESFSGQLGHSKTDIGEVPMPSNQLVRQIACGNQYSLCLTESNNVYYWGTCKFLAPSPTTGVSVTTTLFKTSTPTLWQELKRYHIEQIASGAVHMLFLRRDNVVLSVGSPGYGCLGRTGNYKIPLPVEKIQNLPITKVGCGYQTSTAHCASTGQVFVWGRNDNLQCGVEGKINLEVPTELPELKNHKVSDIQCGYAMSYAITESGPYQWGQTSPILIDYFVRNQKSVVSFAVGMHHTIALTSNGEVYTWGRSHLGQCGHGDTFTYTYPTRLRLHESISQINASGNLSLALTGFLRTPLSEDIEKCINNKNSFPDIIFKVDGSEIYAHRAMLIARCHQLKILDKLLGDQTVKITPATTGRNQYPDGIIPITSPTEARMIEVDYRSTLDGTPVTKTALLSVLKYIYTDVLSIPETSDSKSVLSICDDFGLARLKGLLTSASKMTTPSTYIEDLDILIPTPPGFKPESNAEIKQTKQKEKFKNLAGAFADLTLVATETGATVPAHRFILAARAEYFTTLLSGGMIEATQRVVNLISDESTCMWLLRFLYTDQPCKQDVNVSVELLKLGAMLQMQRLVFLCSRFIEKELDTETTVYMYHLTSTHHIDGLGQICWDIMSSDWVKVLKSDYWNTNLTAEEQSEWNKKFNDEVHAIAK